MIESKEICLSCNRLETEIKRQSEVISQLMRIVASTNERVTLVEQQLSHRTHDFSLSYPMTSSSRVND
ncbi:hypothetical protein [Halalkalibacillus halophilus]|uniref:hypothetical protein n=1 Tax=Halalkalibacillus halophilus TaxID=392827 RepID=UPI00041ED951|nr:hypothetical protein [Halalkalibacillus halophilus]